MLLLCWSIRISVGGFAQWQVDLEEDAVDVEMYNLIQVMDLQILAIFTGRSWNCCTRPSVEWLPSP